MVGMYDGMLETISMNNQIINFNKLDDLTQDLVELNEYLH